MSEDYGWRGARTWTPAEAAQALPLVRRIADDLVRTYGRWRDVVDSFEYATAAAQADAPSAEAERLMGDAQALAAEIDGFRAELEDLDIAVLRVEAGLVAFRGERDGAVAPLYWMPGEPAPAYDAPTPPASANGTLRSWPSRAHDVAGKRSRA